MGCPVMGVCDVTSRKAVKPLKTDDRRGKHLVVLRVLCDIKAPD